MYDGVERVENDAWYTSTRILSGVYQTLWVVGDKDTASAYLVFHAVLTSGVAKGVLGCVSGWRNYRSTIREVLC